MELLKGTSDWAMMWHEILEALYECQVLSAVVAFD